MKHVSDDRQTSRGTDERNYTLESYGKRVDPLAEYRVEEERLQNERSPYPDNGDDRLGSERIYSSRNTDFNHSSSALPPK